VVGLAEVKIIAGEKKEFEEEKVVGREMADTK
jgi:hypothetical protein